MGVHRFLLLLVLLAFSLGGLTACAEKPEAVPGPEDVHFAAFYSDYLLLSGVAAAEGDSAVAVLDYAALDSLLSLHQLTVEGLHERTEQYRKDPELWQKVLLMVREELRGKSQGGQ